MAWSPGQSYGPSAQVQIPTAVLSWSFLGQNFRGCWEEPCGWGVAGLRDGQLRGGQWECGDMMLCWHLGWEGQMAGGGTLNSAVTQSILGSWVEEAMGVRKERGKGKHWNNLAAISGTLCGSAERPWACRCVKTVGGRRGKAEEICGTEE